MTTKQELEKFKTKFRKQYISTMTSPQFKYPADSKELAEINWITIAIIFNSTVEEFLNQRSK